MKHNLHQSDAKLIFNNFSSHKPFDWFWWCSKTAPITSSETTLWECLHVYVCYHWLMWRQWCSVHSSLSWWSAVWLERSPWQWRTDVPCYCCHCGLEESLWTRHLHCHWIEPGTYSAARRSQNILETWPTQKQWQIYLWYSDADLKSGCVLFKQHCFI